jgi:hypothetical protein
MNAGIAALKRPTQQTKTWLAEDPGAAPPKTKKTALSASYVKPQRLI